MIFLKSVNGIEIKVFSQIQQMVGNWHCLISKSLKEKFPKKEKLLPFMKTEESFFRRKTIGQGVVYSFSTLPNRDWSNLGEGFVLVPLLIRIFDECSENPALNLSECGDSASLEYNELTPYYWNSKPKTFR